MPLGLLGVLGISAGVSAVSGLANTILGNRRRKRSERALARELENLP